MRVRPLLSVFALASVTLALLATTAFGGPSPTTCRAVHWCTITAAGDSSSTATQFAIGNVPSGTVLAITQQFPQFRQVGGEILSGELQGVCAWSQYQRDWAPVFPASPPACANPVHNTVEFVASAPSGAAMIWTGCYPRCFGGVPLRFDRRCGKGGRTFCYSHNCTEYANYYPWEQNAHPSDPLRRTYRHSIDIRYLARYGDVWTGNPYYMVRDPQIGHGRGNWVFVSGLACRIVAGPTGTYRHPPRHQ
jgi:hypothetical protein